MDSQLIDRLLTLSQLSVDDDAKTELRQDLETIIEYVEIMQAVDTDSIEPLAHAFDLDQPLRCDVADPEIDRELMQSTAPTVEAGFYLVPKVIPSR